MLADTLPAHTIPSVDRFMLPIAAGDRRATLTLTRPDDTGSPAGLVESLTVEAVGSDAYGATLRDLSQRGIYQVSATASRDAAARPDNGLEADATDRRPAAELLWRQPLAVNGPARESEPAVFDAESFAARHAEIDGLRWIGPDDAIEFSGARVVGHDAWWWMLAASGLCLVGESLLLARPREDRP
jgi:hypothetical protein